MRGLLKNNFYASVSNIKIFLILVFLYGLGLSVAVHGFCLDRNIDVFMLFVSGIGISLLMGAFFFPLFYLGGEERSEVFLFISALGAGTIFMSMVNLVNRWFGDKMSDMEICLAGTALLGAAAVAFLASYAASVRIFRKKEC